MTLTVIDDDGTVSIRANDRTIARYRAATEASKPHFETLVLPNSAGDTAGRNVVLAAPHDHQWHLGLFFCQKLIDGINCWESELFESQDRPHGYAENLDYELVRQDGEIEIIQNVTWKTSAGEKLLADTRDIRLYEPSDGGYLVVWEQEIEAENATRYLSSETLHGHYSGFSVRLRRSMTDGQVRVEDTTGANDQNGPRGRWCDYSGGIDGRIGTTERWTGGLTLMDHPSNDHHPVRWFTATEPFGFVAVNPTYQTVTTVAKGTSVSWQWGAWIHSGTPSIDAIEDAYDQFVART